MKIKTQSLLFGAKKAEGLVVIIDVLRAATTACCLLEKKPSAIILARDIEKALEIKKKDPEVVLVGEIEGQKAPGFDFGNSPSEIGTADLTGKKIVFRTSSGVAGIKAAKNAEEILLAGFVNIKATVAYIREKKPKTATLVAMGWAGRKKADEDELCAQYLSEILRFGKPDYKKTKKKVLEGNGARRFLENRKGFPEKDLHLSLELDRFDYATKTDEKEGNLIITKKQITCRSSSSAGASSSSSPTYSS